MSFLIALLLASGPAAPGPAAQAPATSDTATQAREHFKRGQTHYSLGEFEEAVKEFRETYRLRQEPALLFNMGQAYRQLHDWQQALFNYRQYLNLKPDAPNRAEVEGLLKQMEHEVELEKEQKARAARSASAPPESILTTTRPEPGAPPPGSPWHAPSAPPPPAHDMSLRIAGYAALGAGVLAEGGALLLHGSAQSAADEFNSKYATGRLSANDVSLKSTAQSRGSLATVALIGGAALLITGAVLSFAF